jgi:hypothetical protein
MTPDAASTVTPLGRFVALQVYGAEPPLASNVPVKVEPIVAGASEAVMIEGGVAFVTNKVNATLSVCPIPSAI